jgi:RNA polymerase sigma factor (TIGR02999 family)
VADAAEIPELIGAAEVGDRTARDRLFAALYDELRQLARRALRGGAGAGVSATTLVHEVYADMAARDSLAFADRAHFLGYAARAMRGLLIDALRSGAAQKRGGGFVITSLDGAGGDPPDAGARSLERLSDALDELAQREPQLAQLVDLKFFCGFSLAEIAQLTGVSERTAQRSWEKARLLLFEALRAA